MKAAGTLTLENLLTAVRTGKRASMDYAVDDSFGGINAKTSAVPTILEQIEKGYLNSTKQLEEELADEQMQEAAEEFDKMLYTEVRNAMGSEDAVLRHLAEYHQNVSADTLFFAKAMLKGSSNLFRNYQKLTEKEGEPEDDINFGEDKLLEEFTGEESAVKSYEEMTGRMKKKLEETAFTGQNTALDMKAISTLYKQIGFMNAMAKEENYEMPVNIGGSITAINLKMIHTDNKECKVAISFETKELGKNEAEFSFVEEKLSGYSICEDKQTKELLEQNQELFAELLFQEDLQAGDIRFLTGEGLNPEEFALRTARGREEGKTPDTLYKAAKAYIGYIQEISKQKGSSAYENQL